MKTATILLLLVPSMLLAQSGQNPTPLPKSGVLSSSVQAGYGGTNVSLPWGSKYNEAPPVAGSVTKVSDRELQLKLFNNSDDTYAVTVAAVQIDENGRTIKTDHYSYMLKGKEKIERRVSGSPLTFGAQLELRSWKNLTPRKPAASEVAVVVPTTVPTAPPVPRVKKEGQRSFSPKAPEPVVVPQ